jgi:hypothetical protein
LTDGAKMLGHQKRLPSEEEERVSHPPREMRSTPKANHPIQDGSMPQYQYFRGSFHLCMGTMPMLFTPFINLVWKLQDI